MSRLPDGGRTIAGSGLYYIADSSGGEYTILKRNPNYPGPRTATLDAIALREGVDASLALERVQNEGWDGILQSYDLWRSWEDRSTTSGGPTAQPAQW